MNIEQNDCYMQAITCDSIDKLRDELSYFSNINKDKVIVSHDVCVIGMNQFLLSIVYYYLED